MLSVGLPLVFKTQMAAAAAAAAQPIRHKIVYWRPEVSEPRLSCRLCVAAKQRAEDHAGAERKGAGIYGPQTQP